MDCDLAIVGGGPAGIATALFALAEAPRLKGRIVVLEKERYPREKICAGAIGARADRLLATIGVSIDVPSAPVSGISVRAGGGALVEHVPGGRSVGRVVRRVEFDAALADRGLCAGVRIEQGARVTEVGVDRGGVRLESSMGTVRARAVVGADGVGSFVRRAIGAPRGRLTAQVVEVDTPAASGDLERSVMHFDVVDRSLTGYAWDFPTIVGGEELVCRGIYELKWDRDGERESAGAEGCDVSSRLLQRLDGMGLATAELKLKRFAERGLTLSEPMSRSRVLLVGEAAGIDPVLGEGIPQAIQYGATAGRYVARCLERDDLAFSTWRKEVLGSRVGLDLRVRTNAVRFFYGRTRPIAERWVTSSRNLAVAGLTYFGGERVPRSRIAAAFADLARAAIDRRRPGER